MLPRSVGRSVVGATVPGHAVRGWSLPASCAVLPPGPPPDGEPAVAAFDRVVDWSWRRLSYSRLTDHSPRDGTLGETEEVSTVDEPGLPQLPAAGIVGNCPSLMNDQPAGPAFGTLVHSVLQHIDTSPDDLSAEVRARTAEAVAARLMSVDVDGLAADRGCDQPDSGRHPGRCVPVRSAVGVAV